jgi:hypothetical protein
MTYLTGRERLFSEMMDVLDTNNDGIVDFEEFCAGWDNIFVITSATTADAEAEAATRVQAAFRGHSARREQVMAPRALLRRSHQGPVTLCSLSTFSRCHRALQTFRQQLREDRAASHIQAGWRKGHCYAAPRAVVGEPEPIRQNEADLSRLREAQVSRPCPPRQGPLSAARSTD